MADRITAILLAGGSGKRMNSTVPKQYMTLAGKPLLYHALRAFEESEVTGIVLVTGRGEQEYCRQELIEKYNISKLSALVEGGKERYHSVYAGLLAADGADYVLIHDGARPLVTAELISRSIEAAKKWNACVTGMPVKDTIKVVGEDGFAKETPDRGKLWQIQTPQSFSYAMIMDAYQKLMAVGDDSVTDDAMVLEKMTKQRVRLIEGDYRNIKVTTPEDMCVAEAYLKDMSKK